MTEVAENGVEAVVRAIESSGGSLNSAVFRMASPQASDSLDRAIECGRVRWVGLGGAVEIVPDAVRLTYKSEETRPQAEIIPTRPSKSYSNGRRQHYSALAGPLPARIRQLAARLVHRIRICGDQDAQGRPISTKRALERSLHASRLPEWTPAIDLLIARKSIEIVGHEIVIKDVVFDLPDPHDPTGEKQAKELKQAKRRSRRKRPLSAWVRRKIAEREGRIPAGRS